MHVFTYSDLLQSIDSDTYSGEIMNSPTPINKSSSTIANIAKSIASQVGYEPGGDLRAVVTRLGGKISHVDLWGGNTSDSGSIQIKGSSFEIRLGMATGPLRDRFTIAHEIGHFVLHYLYRKQILHEDINELVAQRFGTDQAEKEANWFAAAFLMPTEEYKREYELCNGDHVALSRIFNVSRPASEVRAKSLQLQGN
jgi:predicted transcriptional regulator